MNYDYDVMYHKYSYEGAIIINNDESIRREVTNYFNSKIKVKSILSSDGVLCPNFPLNIFAKYDSGYIQTDDTTATSSIIYIPDITVKSGDTISLPIYHYNIRYKDGIEDKIPLNNFEIGIYKTPKFFKSYNFTSPNFKSELTPANIKNYQTEVEYIELFRRTIPQVYIPPVQYKKIDSKKSLI